MTQTPQRRALQKYRARLAQRGLARFEVRALAGDRELIRDLARRLADGGADAARIRAAIGRAIAVQPPRKGGILEALRRSPLVGADLDLQRSYIAERDTGL